MSIIFDHVSSAIEDWDVSQVNDMSYLFRDERSCNPPIARWNVTRVTTFVSDDEVIGAL